MTPEVVVVGSINHDLTVFADRLPRPGETVLGRSHIWGGGGKGANQAVAAARLGSTVAMVGRIGDDDSGRSLLGALTAEGIDTSGVSVDPVAPTGLAVITVDDDAENMIVVSPGANQALQPQSLDMITGASVVLAQLEIPIETVAATAEAATGTMILNPAPATDLDTGLLEQIDVLVPNRSELSRLSGTPQIERIEEAASAIESLHFRGDVAVTLGSDGALIATGGETSLVPAPTIQAVDPTGAGDAFCGAMAHKLSTGADLETAVRFAVAAGAVAATRLGAQPAMPNRDEVQHLLSTG